MTRPALAEVAQAYRAAVEQGRPPTKSVADHFGVAHHRATRLVQAARASGDLEAASGPGARMERNRKAVLVADSLGVSYDALVGALRQFANGDLRVGRDDGDYCSHGLALWGGMRENYRVDGVEYENVRHFDRSLCRVVENASTPSSGAA